MISIFQNLKINKINLIIFIFFYFTFFLGFYLNENPTIGAQLDFNYHLKTLLNFDKDFIGSLLNYHLIDNSTRISPIFLIYLHSLKKILINTDLLRFISLNFFLISPYIFYKCLKLKFPGKNKNILFLISSLIFISPSFRGNSIWPESSMLGLIFFLLSILYFIKFEKDKLLYYCMLNTFFLAIAAYIRPTYALFSLFFFFNFFKHYFFNVKIFFIIFLNLFLSLPAFYYIFILKVDFISNHGLSFNFVNKFYIISSIIFFYFLPFLPEIYKSKINFFFSKKNIYLFSFLAFFFLILIKFFDYNLYNAGGGIFLHISNYFFNNNYIFYIISFISIIVIFKLCSLNLIFNLPLIIILFLLSPQTHIFHKYFDPIILILIFLLFRLDLKKVFNFKYLIIIYSYFTLYYLTSLINSVIIKF